MNLKDCLPSNIRLFSKSAKATDDPLDLARACWLSKKYDDALVLADSLLANDPGNKSGLWTRAITCWKLERFADAIRALDQATGLQRPKPESFRTYTSIPLDKSSTTKLLGESLAVVVDLEQFLEGEVGAYQGFSWAASHYHFDIWNDDRKALALKYCDKALRLNPDRSKRADYYDFRANCFNSLGRHKETLADASKALSLSNGQVGNFNRYLACFGLGDYSNALTAITAHLTLKRQQSDSLYYEYNSRGTCYLFLGRLQEAIHDFTIAIALNSKYASSLLGRASAYIRMDQYSKALGDLESYIESGDSHSRKFGTALRTLLLFSTGMFDFSPAKIKLDVSVLMPTDSNKLPYPYHQKPGQLNLLLNLLSKIEAAKSLNSNS